MRTSDALLPAVVWTSVALALLGSASRAQTLYGFSGTTGDVVQFHGGGLGACGYPGNALLNSFSALNGPGCAALTAPGTGPLLYGDIALDTKNNVLYVTDGFEIATINTDGTGISTTNLFHGYMSNPYTGMGFNSAGSNLYLTDGKQFTNTVSTLKNCPFTPFSTGLKNLPIAGFATDIEYDPFDNTLWCCDDTGIVTHFTTTGSLLSSFTTAPFMLLPIGLAVSTGSHTLAVTDGNIVVHYDTSGAFASPGFWAQSPAHAAPVLGLVGLAYGADPIRFGAATTSLGSPLPTIGWSGGFTVLPNPSFAVRIAGTAPASLVQFWLGAGPSCPAIPFSGVDVLIDPSILFLLGSKVANGAGNAVLALPLTTSMSAGGQAFVQAFSITPSLELQATEGLAFTLSLQ